MPNDRFFKPAAERAMPLNLHLTGAEAGAVRLDVVLHIASPVEIILTGAATPDLVAAINALREELRSMSDQPQQEPTPDPAPQPDPPSEPEPQPDPAPDPQPETDPADPRPGGTA